MITLIILLDIKLNLSSYASIILMLSKTYYAQNYAGIIGLGLVCVCPQVCAHAHMHVCVCACQYGLCYALQLIRCFVTLHYVRSHSIARYHLHTHA